MSSTINHLTLIIFTEQAWLRSTYSCLSAMLKYASYFIWGPHLQFKHWTGTDYSTDIFRIFDYIVYFHWLNGTIGVTLYKFSGTHGFCVIECMVCSLWGDTFHRLLKSCAMDILIQNISVYKTKSINAKK